VTCLFHVLFVFKVQKCGNFVVLNLGLVDPFKKPKVPVLKVDKQPEMTIF